MLTTLFWNIYGRPLVSQVAALVEEHSVDVVVLAECDNAPEEFLSALGADFHIPKCQPSRIVLFSRLPPQQFREIHLYMGKVSVRVATFGGQEFLWAFVHLLSKKHGDDHHHPVAGKISRRLRRIENERNHHRTILCGDFNMNPFETGFMEATCLHAMMTRATVEKGHRKVDGKSYPFFYNPMWGLFGDVTKKPPGTYHKRGRYLSYEWNMFDQVLFRKDVLPYFQDDVRIPDRANDQPLITRSGIPNKRRFSDHLPLLFSLHLPEASS